ncbi:acetate/propionate family kinase [Companilactobacillus halodurans]|uniref:Acetate kinase n=1 Tax=Companilactobacillus halodurans TaxID=2584183 RepID=A0A5P0ZXY5_9LACO|nr:acetate kinase [Companilactobacillus halodurans]MQS75521.1 acetate kinase [Companilactobacillus halodurans]MQS97765.1 acetate kinase [Companilactobacillus halodurans]
MSKVLIVNSGSSTFKWKLYGLPDENVISEGMVDRLGQVNSVFEINFNGDKIRKNETILTHETAVKETLQMLLKINAIKSLDEISRVGHRVVAGGTIFKDSVVITPKVVQQISDLSELAPLHNPSQVAGIKAFEKLLPKAIQVAAFDTSFHQTMKPVNYLYSVPYEYYKKYGVRKFGAQGISHRYVSNMAADYLNKPIEDMKIISCHLGSGASIDAISGGKSVDTSMGFTPESGLTMSTRAGDIDPSLVAFLMEKLKIDKVEDMVKILNNDSGLLGLSGLSPDLRDLLAVKDTNERANIAIQIYVNRIVKYIGSYIALLNGIDALIFIAGTGANNPEIRSMIVDSFRYLGIKLDKKTNKESKGINKISAKDSTCDVLVIPTNEELMILKDVIRLTGTTDENDEQVIEKEEVTN